MGSRTNSSKEKEGERRWFESRRMRSYLRSKRGEGEERSMATSTAM
ncbi:hypothetical protein COLO4_02849 [Corchorus olitorius]|uniref:Uncharacterized protein n=1 Tax=Corchorus olitorius TaxID=93759 RepID=A0A1R3L032_9ROSI|nr:hypothetical protein COLO4_02849 [Corchorus olitorius]